MRSDLWTRRRFLQHSAAAAMAAAGGGLAGCQRSATVLVPAAKSFDDYRALVCVFLHGGNDGYNMLVPSTADKYRLYADARQDLAVERGQLLPLAGAAADGCDYGLHPRCSELAELYGQGHAAVLANVGSLSFPTARADYLANRVPQGLFSHQDQRDQWHNTSPDAEASTGWAGRIGDVLAGSNGDTALPLNLSIAGNNLLQRGSRTQGFSFLPSGPQRLHGLDPEGSDAELRAAFDLIATAAEGDRFEQSYAQAVGSGLQLNQRLASELAQAPPLSTAFPGNNELAEQLQLVAQLIGCRGQLGMRRQIFYVSLPGFDNHGDQAEVHPDQLQRLSQALRAFHAATVEMGVASQVTAFTASDFGRSLSLNGKGTDHGWSNHQLIVGGAVRGGSIYGRPPSLEIGGADDTRGGRFIPQTSVDEYAATLARWFGVGEGDLGYVLPNLGRFASRDLGFMA